MGDVMVHKLSPLHHMVSVKLTGSINIWNNVDTHLVEHIHVLVELCLNQFYQSGGGKRTFSIDGLHFSFPYSVTVVWQQYSLEGSVGS